MEIFYYISSFSIFILSIYIYKNLSNMNNLITAIMLFTLGLAPFSWVLFQDSGILTNELNIWILFFPFLLLFSINYPYEIEFTKNIKNIRYRYLLFVPYFLYFLIYFIIKILGMILLKEQVLFGLLKSVTDILISQIFSFTIIILNIFYIAISYYILDQKIQHTESNTLKKQLNLFVVGLRLFAFVFVTSIITQYFGIFNEIITPVRMKFLYSFAIIANAVLISVAMAKYKFLDIKLKRKSFLYYLVWGFLIFLYTFSTSLIILKLVTYKNNYLLFGSIFVFFIIFIFYYKAVDKFISYFFIRDRMDYEEIIKNFFLKVSSLDSFQEIRNIVIDELQKLLNIEKVDVILVDKIDKKYYKKSSYSFLQMPERFQKNYKWAVYFFSLKFQDKIYGYLLIGNKISETKFNKAEIDLLNSISVQISMVLHNMDINKELYEKKLMEKQLNLARKIQFSLLPDKNIPHEKFNIYWRYKPATRIGGDYCDIIKNKNNDLFFVMADVSGKGINGAIYMSMIRTFFHTTVDLINIEQILLYLNDYLKNKLPAKIFVTMLIFNYKNENDKLQYIHLGHNEPILYRSKKNSVEFLQADGMALGLTKNEVFKKNYKINNINLEKNDFIFSYTDGITEARNNYDQLYGQKRLFEILDENKNKKIEDIVNKVSQDIFNFRGNYGQTDDIAMLSFKRK
ncbi:MAG: SpoIIE family protein phosphatase [Candidatus Mcinerneyibacterium aminivorans]|uniref:SpoIIE family protein phosphatase n=1 Tax=Candidatus Mcinerneyibacterium aminivorans TaxID=2703815 RepID=A0A5D0MF26_9BACT|nr:MAG: SpoIIE family protein phosphatase [Candidatus Mcinerneyibacterium aminivorans]